MILKTASQEESVNIKGNKKLVRNISVREAECREEGQGEKYSILVG